MSTPRAANEEAASSDALHDAARAATAEDPAADTPEDDQRVVLTPGLVVLGLLAIALGLFAAVVMSAHSLAR